MPKKNCRRKNTAKGERSATLGARPDIAYVLVFENRGGSVGATIAHPHGQIYAFDFVPDSPRRELERGDAFDEPGDRLVAEVPGWRAWVLHAPVFPYALILALDTPVPDLPSLDDAGRDGLALILIDVLERLDLAFEAQTPYMMWIHQRPFDGGAWPQARLHVEIVSPWRASGVARYIAAGELGSGVYFNLLGQTQTRLGPRVRVGPTYCTPGLEDIRADSELATNTT